MNVFMRLLVRGLMVGLPIVLTIAIIGWLLRTIEKWFSVPLSYVLGSTYTPGLGLVLGLLATIALGAAASTWLGRQLLSTINSILERLPLVKSIYGAIKDVFNLFARSDNKDAFDKTVVVEWGGRRFLGFVTRDDGTDLPKGLMGPNDVIVYLPMGYQIGGFPIIVSRDQLTPIDMSVEAALKFALTAGASTDGGRRKT